MKMDELRTVLHSLEANDGLVLPYGVIPELPPSRAIGKKTWNDVDWNPPRRFPEPELGPDPAASPKPRWNTVQARYEKIFKPSTEDRLQQLKQKYLTKIVRAYHADGPLDEIHMRLRGATLPEQDKERDRLRREYHRAKARLLAGD